MNELQKGKSIKELNIGDNYKKEIMVTDKAVEYFAKASGDKNPIHLDEEYASKTVFKQRVVHGVLLIGVVSGILGLEFPGPGSIAREITAKFAKPVYINDTISIEITIIKLVEKLNLCTISYKVYNSSKELAVKGEAVILPPL